ncbi:MAG: ornithine carbamoyltransferase [Candidatus Nomurabacteria bacterium]|jgi:ornithine carbamoyltransferase|nr:ornithine carbamoyltransferase [Candidatus Nomurabacteria bacterium]
MALSIRGRSLLGLKDFTEAEIRLMLDTAKHYKKLKQKGELHQYQKGKSIALLFEKTSTRTRCAFEVAAYDLGINAVFLGKDDIQLGKKESIEDTAKVLGRMFDGIEFRGFKQESVDALAKYSGVPVWNGLTDTYHPTQILADFLTIEEHVGKLKGVKLVYIGDGRNNMSNSLMVGSSKMGLHYVVVAPKELWPEESLIKMCRDFCKESGGTIEVTDDIDQAVKDADVLYTDVWASMGEEDKFAERIKLLKPYKVTMDVVKATGNPDVIFMHALPSFHDLNTAMGQEMKQKFGLNDMEVTDEVFLSKHSVVFDEAENRMHTIKAVIALTI